MPEPEVRSGPWQPWRFKSGANQCWAVVDGEPDQRGFVTRQVSSWPPQALTREQAVAIAETLNSMERISTASPG